MAKQTLRSNTNTNLLAAESSRSRLRQPSVSQTDNKSFGSAIKQSECDWLLNCLNNIGFWQLVSYCCSWMPFLIKDSQVVGSRSIEWVGRSSICPVDKAASMTSSRALHHAASQSAVNNTGKKRLERFPLPTVIERSLTQLVIVSLDSNSSPSLY